jgi:hypothetical protein
MKEERPYIELVGRDEMDRLGANLLSYIVQTIFGIKHNYYIYYHYLNYQNSIFINALKDYIDSYNTFILKGKEKINYITDPNYAILLHTITINEIKMDIFYYFKTIIYEKFSNYLSINLKRVNITIPFNPKKTILVHLRLDDLNFNNSYDFDGNLSGQNITDIINNGYVTDDGERFLIQQKIYFSKCMHSNKEYKEVYYNSKINRRDLLFSFMYQSPMKDEKVNKIIEIVKKENPDHEILIVKSKTGITNLPYKTISSDNPDIDLYYLSICDKVILSRSTFALNSIFFSNASAIWVPYCGLSASLGIKSKYDKIELNYFN